MDWEKVLDALGEPAWDVSLFTTPYWLGVDVVGLVLSIAICWWALRRRGSNRNVWYRPVILVLGTSSFLCLLLVVGALAPLPESEWLFRSLGISEVQQLLPNGVTLLEQRIRILGWSSVWLVMAIVCMAVITRLDPRRATDEQGRAEGAEEVRDRPPDSPHFYLFLSKKDPGPPFIWLGDEKWYRGRWHKIPSVEICFGEGKFSGQELEVEAHTVKSHEPGQWVCLRFRDCKALVGHTLPQLSSEGQQQFTYSRRRKEGRVRDREFFTVRLPRGTLVLQFSLSAPEDEGGEG